MITENNFTTDELIAALEATPTLLDTVIKPTLEGRKFSLLDETGKKALEQQAEQNYMTTYTPQWEKLVKETAGVDKVDGEDYNMYLTRVLGERKTLDTELQGYRGKTDLTQVEKDRIKQLESAVLEHAKEVKKIKDEAAGEVSKAKLGLQLSNEVAPVLNKLIKDTRPGVAKAQEVMIAQTMNELSNMASKDSFGRTILINPDTKKPLVDASNMFITPTQYFEGKMTEYGFVDIGKKQPGAGGQGADPSNLAIPGGATNEVELMDFLRKGPMKGKSQTELVKEFDKYAHLLSS